MQEPSSFANVTEATQIVDSLGAGVLNGKDGGRYRLIITDSKPVRPRIGWLYVAVGLRDERGQASRSPLAMGIVSGGGRGVRPWMELRIYPQVQMAGGATVDARGAGIEEGLINLIGTLIPPGGHLMIEYESAGQNETHAALLLRVPPAATALGAMMFQAGFRGAFKDWYISEGGHEGPRKLQANKSPSQAAARLALQQHRGELTAFLKMRLQAAERDREVIERAQVRARRILKTIGRA